jgi:hypothetical protein
MGKEEKLIQTSFLIPIREDKRVGNGKLHPDTRFTDFWTKICTSKHFSGAYIGPGLCDGFEIDPKTKKIIPDKSKKYFIAVKKKDLKSLRDFLKEAACTFFQQRIYFEVAGKVEFVKRPKRCPEDIFKKVGL